MDKELFEAKESILTSQDPAEWLLLADRYIAQFNAQPKMFRLPKDHIRLKAVLENFAYDADGFLSFVKQIRDEASEVHWDSLHTFYRSILARLAQKARRARLAKAVAVAAASKGVKFTPKQSEAAAKWFEASWGKQRLDRLAEVRKQIKAKRLSTEERAEILENFWKDLDALIESGDIPLPPESVYEGNTDGSPSVEP